MTIEKLTIRWNNRSYLRSLIVDKIICEEENTLTGQFNSLAITHSVGVSHMHVTIVKVWQKFCNSTGCPSHLSYGDPCWKQCYI